MHEQKKKSHRIEMTIKRGEMRAVIWRTASAKRRDERVCMRTRRQCYYQKVHQEVVLCSSPSVILHILLITDCFHSDCDAQTHAAA